MTKCIICGKEIEPGVLGKARSNARYCSDECRQEGKRRYSSNYSRNRRKNDIEWRDKRRSESAMYQKAYRERLKTNAINEHAEKLAELTNPAAIKRYLDEHFRLKMS
jgi:hypothetical protein